MNVWRYVYMYVYIKPSPSPDARVVLAKMGLESVAVTKAWPHSLHSKNSSPHPGPTPTYPS